MEENYKSIFLQYVKSGIGHCEDDEKIEEFAGNLSYHMRRRKAW